MGQDLNVLVVSKGHEYVHDSFLNMFTEMGGVSSTLVEQPAAQIILQPEYIEEYDTVFFYDMSGIPGAGLLHDGANDTGIPPARYVKAIENILDIGLGMVMVNHATVGWPLWPLWRQITGTSFMLTAGELNGRQTPGSGYRGGHGPLQNATIKLTTVNEHPVLEGLEDGFEITDELYLKTADYETDVFPLLRGEYEFVMENFTPPPMASPKEQQTWSHPPGSDLIVWANACGNSPIVVSDVGDSPLAYDDRNFRKLIENSLRWTASAEAKQWARDQ